MYRLNQKERKKEEGKGSFSDLVRQYYLALYLNPKVKVKKNPTSVKKKEPIILLLLPDLTIQRIFLRELLNIRQRRVFPLGAQDSEGYQ